MKTQIFALFAAGALAATVHEVQAQVVITSTLQVYSQNFDGVLTGTNANDFTFVNNSTFLGWYTQKIQAQYSNGATASTTRFRAFGADAGNERALGFGNTDTGPTNNHFGLRLTNNTGAALTQFKLTYTGEQWRDTSTTANSLLFSYLVTAGSSTTGALGDTGYTSVTALNYTSTSNSNIGNPVLGTPVATTPNIGSNLTVTGLNWQNGQDLWLRWTKPSNAHYLGIDNVTFQIPEPGSVALLVIGFSALLFHPRRRL